MIKSVKVTNHLNESIIMELADPEKSGFIIKNIDGLGPVKANINLTSMATNDGSVYNSSRLNTRNIVLSLQFIENPTIEDTRLMSYKYFPVKREIKMCIETDTRNCEIVGRVESNSPDIFSKEEGCQVSIICPDPYFYERKINEKVLSGIESLFEFPFENNSLTENLLEMGNINRVPEANVIYTGDAEVGMEITLHALGPIRGFKMFNLRSRQIISLNDEKINQITGGYIDFGDDIIINTERGKKSVIMMRNGITYNILNSLEKPLKWFTLSNGNNVFAFTVTSGLSYVEMIARYKTLYEGV